jgi:hypothetical protein
MKRLEKLNIENQKHFNDSVADFLEKTDKSIEWLVSLPVSRHTYQSKLYFTLLQLLINEKDNIPILKNQKPVYIRIKLIYGKAKSIYRIIQLVFKEIVSKDSKRKNEVRGKSIKLLDTFILSNSIKQRKYIDRYYNGLLDNLTEVEKDKIFFLPTFIGSYSSNDVKAIHNNSCENFIFRQDFLKPIDYFIAFWKLFKMQFPQKGHVLFKNIDVTKEFYREFSLSKYNTSSYQGILNYFLVRRLKQSKVDIQLLIDWNENQPIDKGLIRGMKDFYSNVKTKGYQGYIISTDFNFYIQPTDFEIQNKVIPDEILVVGDGLKERINKFSKQVKVNTAPAFRFGDVFKEFKRETNNKKIMLALPIGLTEAMDIMNISYEGLKNLSDDIEILVKPHPSLNIKKLKSTLGEKCLAKHKFIYGDFNREVSQVDVLIGSTSTTLLETLTKGIPVIVIGSQKGITQNPIPKKVDKRIWKLCYTSNQVLDAFKMFTDIEEIEKKKFIEIGKEIKRGYFQEITQDLCFKFLN